MGPWTEDLPTVCDVDPSEPDIVWSLDLSTDSVLVDEHGRATHFWDPARGWERAVEVS